MFISHLSLLSHISDISLTLPPPFDHSEVAAAAAAAAAATNHVFKSS